MERLTSLRRGLEVDRHLFFSNIVYFPFSTGLSLCSCITALVMEMSDSSNRARLSLFDDDVCSTSKVSRRRPSGTLVAVNTEVTY